MSLFKINTSSADRLTGFVESLLKKKKKKNSIDVDRVDSRSLVLGGSCIVEVLMIIRTKKLASHARGSIRPEGRGACHVGN